MIAGGLRPETKVAINLRNCPEFLEIYVAFFKARLIPANVNYRYEHDELVHVLSNSDAEAVFFDASHLPLVTRLREVLPKLGRFVVVGDAGPLPAWAESYDAMIAGNSSAKPKTGRSGEDPLLLYTGGTTGLPKGVTWQQDVMQALGTGGSFYLGEPPCADIAEILSRLDHSGKRIYVACPLMHATGLFTSLTLMNVGWTIETTASQRFDAAALWQQAALGRVAD